MNKLSKNQWIATGLALIIVVWFFSSSDLMTAMFNKTDNSAPALNNIKMTQDETVNSGPTSGINIVDTVVGTGAEAVAGKTVTTHYKGMFQDGRVFDTSIGRAPFSFPLGAGIVIQGWDKGIAGMKVGGKRTLTISSDFAYGPADIKDNAGNVVIPGGSTLIFEVELFDVKDVVLDVKDVE